MNDGERKGPRPSPRLTGVTPYRSPGPAAPVDLLLNGNEGACPDADLFDALIALGPEVLRRYPDPQAFEGWLAARLDVAPERVLVTAGGDEAIDRICRAFLDPGRSLIMPTPSFVMIPRYARLAGAQVVEVPWPQGPYPCDEVLACCGADTAVIAVVSPNNPTGATASAADLRRLSDGAPQALLMVDLAYAEFGEEDLMECSLSLPNAVAVRSMSKAWGMAGCRLGFAVGPADLIAALRAAAGPYSVARPSLALGRARLEEDRRQVSAFVTRVQQERQILFDLLMRLGARPLPSQGNFVTARPRRAAWLRDGLAGLGISVRLLPDLPGLGDCVRITCPGNPAEFERLGQGLERVLAPQALLFDMDGILADVSRSYRAAILKTAAAFGVELEPEAVDAIKAAGQANNDWDVTQRLLQQRGVMRSLEEVTARFEALYQGGEDAPGLREQETLIPPQDLLERLAGRLPLAVVTGRPRADARRFLERFGLLGLFPVCVCMEDGPLKPDPAPIERALAALGVERAWMIGDTPDDMRAARSAGVVPLGCVAPGQDGASQAPHLTAAGAARVLEELADLEEVIP